MVNINDSLAVKPKSKRIFYFDALRAMAIIAVIVIHVFSETMVLFKYGQLPFHSGGWLFEDVLGVCFRFGVDLFLMLAGALSLGRDWDIKTFLGKRLPRIVIPFLFWGFVLSSLLLIFTVVFPDFYWLHDQIAGFLSPVGFLKTLYLFYMAKAICSAPYWFFWMILGTYLIMPIFNKWVANSDMGELEYFLVFWLITCIFDYTLGFPFPVKLTYFVSPIGLVVLGYYLRYTERDILNNPYFAVFLILASAITMVAISYFYSVPTKFYTFDRYSIFMSLEVIGVFLLYKNAGKFNIHLNFFENPEGIFRKSAFALAKYSYGIYLIHAFIVVLLVKLLFQFHVYAMMPIELFIIMVLVLTIVIAVLAMAILSRIPYIGGWIGAK